MHIIKLNATDSTNTYLRQFYSENNVVDYTVVLASKQNKGRGQMGSVWMSDSGKNLTFSVFKGLRGLQIDHVFFLSIVTSLAVINTLRSLNMSGLKIKWPNDILSYNQKICGILIENVIKNSQLDSCIIGIGLNVNQTEFSSLPKASSLKLITGITYDLDEVLNQIIENLKIQFAILRDGKRDALKIDYESYLYRNNKPSTFKDSEGTLFTGFIKGVSKAGKLKVLLEANITKEFDIKEITLMY